MSVQVTCDCGHEFTMVKEDQHGYGLEYPVCEIECPKCNRRANGGNGRTGEISGWMTEDAIEESRRQCEAMQFDVDMNEWYGRGEW